MPFSYQVKKFTGHEGGKYGQLYRYLFQCSTLLFLLTCPLRNYVASFTCRVYFLVAPKKSPARFPRSFIEFSIVVPSNFNA